MRKIETETISVPRRVEPFDVYRQAVSRFGEHHAFLAESMQGPADDCRQSIVAICRLASVRFRAGVVEIDAAPRLARRLAGTMEMACAPTGRSFDSDGRVE